MATSQTEDYNKTLKEVTEYIGRQSLMGPKIKRCLVWGAVILPDLLKKISIPNSVDMDIYKEYICYYIKVKHQLTHELGQAYNIVIDQSTLWSKGWKACIIFRQSSMIKMYLS